MTPEEAELVSLYGTCGVCGAPREVYRDGRAGRPNMGMRCSVDHGHAHARVWHDEAQRFAETGELDPPDRCLCLECR